MDVVYVEMFIRIVMQFYVNSMLKNYLIELNYLNIKW